LPFFKTPANKSDTHSYHLRTAQTADYKIKMTDKKQNLIDQKRSLLGITDVNYVLGQHSLALVDPTLG
jgi:hypothetical protein